MSLIKEIIENLTEGTINNAIEWKLSNREPFMSSDLKYIIIQNSYNYLREAGYSDEQIEIYNERVKKIVAENIQINSFMG